MAEQDDDIVFTDPHTFRRRAVVHDHSCNGPNHADFSANPRFFVVTCEFSGSLLKVSVLSHRVLGRLTLPSGSKPQDIRLSPDGRTFFVADMGRDRLLRIPIDRLKVVGHTNLPSMPHGIYPSRDWKYLYVSDRMAGKVSVVSVANHRVVDTWSAPGSHPDMGGLSADGRTLWLSGRYDGSVYGWNTRTASWSPRSGSVVVHTACSCGLGPGDTRWVTPGTCGEGWRRRGCRAAAVRVHKRACGR